MNARDIHFLVIEDQDFQREVMVCMLAGLGAIHIAQASDGRKALDILQNGAHTVDIVISDLDMPGMDGMEFIRHVGESGIAVAMILMSAHDRSLLASVGTMTEAYGIHLLGTVEKPVASPRLSALLHQFRRPQLRPLEPAHPSFSKEDVIEALSARTFEPLFQPKVELASGRLKGAEALARWRHPQRGIVGPYAFIPLLEASQCIDDLTWIMLEKAAAACRDWHTHGLDMTVSVNLSLASLAKVGFADRITELVVGQGLEPSHMILEVTETIAMTDIGRALENLVRLRIKGFGLSIDDYGTGYSSMQQLARVPFTELKIDQSFVMRAIEKESCRVMLESSLDIARKLGLKAVAEGVETRADWDLLKHLSCDIAQGYFIARPIEAPKMLDWATAWEAPASAA